MDVLTLPLQLLRSRLAIVPQDPILFKGSIRSNLDPFDQCSDEELWDALKRVKMADAVAAMPSSSDSKVSTLCPSNSMSMLSASVSRSSSATSLSGGGSLSYTENLSDKLVSEKGSNLSVGQRQLLCMARAILRKTRILILDEATASVDVETDYLIQETVRTEFNNVTVLSIAHRLHTIAYYDKVLVMDQGTVAEFDSPSMLLNTPGSIFRSMCERTGDLDVLQKIADTARVINERVVNDTKDLIN